jgi:hypothetical protein
VIYTNVLEIPEMNVIDVMLGKFVKMEGGVAGVI